MTRLPALLLLAVALTTVPVYSSSYPTEVVELTDTTFEHDTQASTGQTTGVWAVLFTDSTLKRHDRAATVFDELAKDDDKELIYAKVDVASNIKLARRFGEAVLPPCVLLFRDRQMYLFDQPFDREDVAQRIRDFVTSGFANQEPLDVPPPSERQLNLEAFEANSKMDMKTVGIALAMIVGGLLFQTWAIMNKDKFKPEPVSQPQQPAAAPAASSGGGGAKSPKNPKGSGAPSGNGGGGGGGGKAAGASAGKAKRKPA